jgi:DNA-binding transcriptional ArsR family regulator
MIIRRGAIRNITLTFRLFSKYRTDMKNAEVIDALGALAHEHRLAIYRLLVEQGPEGLPAGVIGERVGLVPSSLTFHLQSLQRAGLITQVRASRQVICSADYAVMNALVGYLTDKCCSASTESCDAACGPRSTSRAPRRKAVA